MIHRVVICWSVFLVCLPALVAEVVPGVPFSDFAVLQRGKPVPVWGTADPGEEVTVTFRGQERQTQANARGRWQVTLEPLEASAVGEEMQIRGKNNVRLRDVVVGEVWLASGQSNMVWTLNSSRDGDIESAGADWPDIRRLNIARRVADAPMDTNATTGWQVTTPESAGGFSAVAFYFARDIQRTLGVPVGIIVGAVGATHVQAWMEPSVSGASAGQAFSDLHEHWDGIFRNHTPRVDEEFSERLARWKGAVEAARKAGKEITESRPPMPKGPTHPARPSGLYNGMIAPVVPYALGGVIWYQGESDVRSAGEYSTFFHTLITGWRAAFGQGDLPFYWVQLANFKGGNGPNWAWLREAQEAALELPATGQAIAIDVGDVTDIHPADKLPIGRRLARLALNRTYGKPIPDTGPEVVGWDRVKGGIVARFSAGVDGLKFPTGRVTGFEIAGEDRVFHPGEATIDGATVLVSSPAVTEPVAVRYAWQSAPEASLFNGDGLPAAPFRTDTWPPGEEMLSEATE